ncbi:SRPBCC domain-containing protein [Peteryoungia desertarenae]|uniref:SRPBCC domain-containing protein n=1 Tax=Peteryoungia desertarenae TaxID=1813451 RepID=A0ABX6QQQ4_9HYPH|nr:SRPBCC domain-containing protein [Peteryoungia desertarenae]QLF70926.1 SRPBCC domain-containing protein [Peteryoungia desertarenae]
MSKLHIENERIFPVSKERLFCAFADPSQLERWWGPHGFTNRIDTFDFRTGGEWHITMTSSDETDFANRWTFQEIVAPHRIVALHHEPMHVFALEMRFDPIGNGTRLFWRMEFDDTPENREIERFIAAANEQNFDRLAALLNELCSDQSD